jgi:LysM repeat protein
MPYSIGRRETLDQVARRYGTSESELRAYNNMSASAPIEVGMTLMVPKRGGTEVDTAQLRLPSSIPSTVVEPTDALTYDAHPTTNYSAERFNSRRDFRSTQEAAQHYFSSRKIEADHKVVKGDTLFSIAKRYGVDPAELRAANHLKGNALKVGQDLTIKLDRPERHSNTQSASVHGRGSALRHEPEQICNKKGRRMVCVTPEPRKGDKDGDGIPDRKDTIDNRKDKDGDGIPDRKDKRDDRPDVKKDSRKDSKKSSAKKGAKSDVKDNSKGKQDSKPSKERQSDKKRH